MIEYRYGIYFYDKIYLVYYIYSNTYVKFSILMFIVIHFDRSYKEGFYFEFYELRGTYLPI